MSFNLKVSNESYSLSGEWQAVLSHIYDLGMVDTNFTDSKGEKKKSQKCIFLWELNKKTEKGNRITTTKEYTASLIKDSNLRKDLESWTGNPSYFDDKEGQDFDIEKLIGSNCLLVIDEKTSEKGKKYNEIVEIKPIQKDLPKLTTTLDRSYCPDWIMKKMSTMQNPTGGNNQSSIWYDDRPF